MKSEEIKKKQKTKHRHRPKVLHVLYETPAVYENSARVEEICKNILPTVFDPVTCEMFKHFFNYKN